MTQHIIRVIDFETTGMEPTDKVVEMGVCDLVNDGGGWMVEEPKSHLYKVDAVPPAARAIHHIAAGMTAGELVFEPELYVWGNCALNMVQVVASHNAAFDGQFWGEPKLPVLCTYKAALRIWPDAPGHSNGCLRYWLEDQGFISLKPDLAEPSHRAGPDAYVTAHVLKAALRYASAKEMVTWTKMPAVQPRISFGKHKGPWSEAPFDYLDWIVNKSDMDADTKWNASREMLRREQARREAAGA